MRCVVPGLPMLTFTIIILLVVVAGFAWVVYYLWPDALFFEDGVLIKKQKWRVERLPVVGLATIRFHYHAVVGFVCEWEFIAASGSVITLNRNSMDKKLIALLEKNVPNFSAEKFYADFKEGDIEDTIVVWKANF